MQPTRRDDGHPGGELIRRQKRVHPRPQMPIAPMIDCVFLMLVFFMVSASLEPQEADISFQLPGVVEQSEPLEMPDEQIIEITESGQVVVNDYAYDAPGASRLVELMAMLSRFKEVSNASRNEAIVTISPHAAVPHQVIVRIMDACSFAGLDRVNFALGEEDG